MNKNKITIAEAKTLLSQINSLEDPIFDILKNDSRKGIQSALGQWSKEREKELQLVQHRANMLIQENQLREKGYQFIAGIDEVGRGPLAGPVVAAAVILPTDIPALPINDSKKLSAKMRNKLYEIIMEQAYVGIGVIDNTVIDKINIYQATKLAMKQAASNLKQPADALLIDAMTIPTNIKQISLIKGDAQSYSIAAASIVAKVYRDQLMTEYASQYPNYQFENNAGYGTKAHLEGLEDYGITPIHRKSFEPIKTKLMKK